MKDEIIEKVWAVRDGIAKECDNDLDCIFERFKAAQKKSKRRVVNRAHLRDKLAPAH